MARFERKAKVLATLNHPKVASLYGLEFLPDGKRLIMIQPAGSQQSVGELQVVVNWAGEPKARLAGTQ